MGTRKEAGFEGVRCYSGAVFEITEESEDKVPE